MCSAYFLHFLEKLQACEQTRLLGIPELKQEGVIFEAIQFASCRVRYCFFQNYNGTMVGDGCSVTHYVPDVFLMSIILFMGTFLLSVELKDFKNALFFPSKVETYVLS